MMQRPAAYIQQQVLFANKEPHLMIKIWKIIKSIIYFILFVFSTGYFLTCLIYAGIAVSWLFIWPLFAIFCLDRFIMLRREIKRRTK